MHLPDSQLCWIYRGQGMATFGADSQPEACPLPQPGPGEVLARVDAVSICASDVKMIEMANDYPLFKDRDFSRHPAVLGHELALTVVACGADRLRDWPPGKRFGVQPDVWLNGERFCIGVNVAGGMAQYVLLGKEVFTSDNGCCAFAADPAISDAALAQTEPLACVEAAFVQHSRSDMKAQGDLLIWLAEDSQQPFILDMPLTASRITLVGDAEAFRRSVSGLPDRHYDYQPQLPARQFDDIIILGNPDGATLSRLTAGMAVNGLLCWLPDSEPQAMVAADIAQIHYHNLSLLGARSRRLSDAFSRQRYRYDYQPGGTLILSGGGGTMGRIHLQRALKSARAPAKIIVTGNSPHRLERMASDFAGLINAAGIEVYYLALQTTPDFAAEMARLVGSQGATDIVVCAPGIEPLSEVVDFLADDGLLVLFSGTRYGQHGPLPLGQVAWQQVTISASSGSSVQDQLRVLEKIASGEALPDFNVAAIGGLMTLKEGLQAVKTGRFTGKVVIYPQLTSLPLLALDQLDSWDRRLAATVNESGWSLLAERLLRESYPQPGDSPG
ncbi:hypothetical protein BTJ39_19480 [Izhakiella australiensis]|uniref:Alcohol dehydrogenase-like N-terminal domain-containing protein n=2 Tax=Izhakiella australiensis TaxID=1926881 RepID=A0A1S8YGB4_9GAMM|nr:hypothetical protein BTJ39_19480 [Izhakiella australiensis]